MRSKEGCVAHGLDIVLPSEPILFPDGTPVVKMWDACTQDIPHPDNYFTKVFAHDFVEHLPKITYIPEVDFETRTCTARQRLVHIHLLNEVWRVLKPHGLFEVCVPVGNVETVHGDPTHCSVWCANSFNYICAKHPENFEWAIMKGYGFKGEFRRVSEARMHGGGHLMVTMSCVKSEPQSLHF